MKQLIKTLPESNGTNFPSPSFNDMCNEETSVF